MDSVDKNGIRFAKIWKVACSEVTMMEKRSANQLFREGKMVKVVSYDGTVGFIWASELPSKKFSSRVPLGTIEQQLKDAER